MPEFHREIEKTKVNNFTIPYKKHVVSKNAVWDPYTYIQQTGTPSDSVI
jgi:hypothetical protein